MKFKGHKDNGLRISGAVSISYLFYSIIYRYFAFDTFGNLISLFLYSGILFIATFFGSLAPDLDIESIPSRWYARIMVVYMSAILWLNSLILMVSEYIEIQFSIFLRWEPAAYLALIFFVCKSDKHRGITHALIWTPSLIAVAYFTNFYVIGAFGIGMWVHNWHCDSISPFRLENWV